MVQLRACNFDIQGMHWASRVQMEKRNIDYSEITYEDCISLHEKIKFDAIIPVPLHKKRFKERGYNQLTTFGQALSKSLNVPYNDNILHRDVYAVTQTKKSFFDRTDDKKTTFGADYTSADHGKHYLLIDDVITTGATLEACGKLLAAIPDSKISIVTLAYSQS